MECLRPLALILALAAPAASANPYTDNVSVRLVPGWQQADGSYIAGLELELRDGWKTYWRAPGDAGIPPMFSWDGSRNVADVQVIWPRPEVFLQNGMRSIGYSHRITLPLRIAPGAEGPVQLDGSLQIGICSDICVPLSVDLTEITLPATRKVVPGIAAAIADRPFSRDEAGVRQVSCSLSPAGKKMHLKAEIEMPHTGGDEVVVVETPDPMIWVSEARTRREGNRLVAEAELMPMSGDAVLLDRSAMRLTVLGAKKAVDIQGCTSR